MTTALRARAIVAVLAAAVLATLAVPTVDAYMPHAKRYHVGGPITLDTNLLSKSGASAWAIDEYLQANTRLPRLGAAFLAAERKYGVNARFLLAAAMHESAWGTSAIARIKHNLFGYNAYDRDPFRYATAHATYTANINATAKFIKGFYLTRGGRWWGGAPTLRSMQQFWSSSGAWGVNVSRIASSIHLDRIPGRAIKIAVRLAGDVLHGGDKASVQLSWTGGDIPKRVRFVATWVPVRLTSDMDAARQPFSGTGSNGAIASPADAATARSTPPTGAQAQHRPTSANARRARTTARSITLAVRTPDQPGSYQLEIEARDSNGGRLPSRERIRIPTVEARVWSDRALSVDVEPSRDGTGATVTITNTGREAIPASPGSDSPVAGAPSAHPTRTFVSVSAIGDDSASPDPQLLLAEPLPADLRPGDSVSLTTPSLESATGRATSWLSVGLSVLGDSGWLQEMSPDGAWFSTSGLVPAGPARAAVPSVPDGTAASVEAASSPATSAATATDAATVAATTVAPRPTMPPPSTESPTPVASPARSTASTADTSPAPTPKPSRRHNSERSRAINYRGTWASASYAGYIGGHVKWSKQGGSTATFTFTGSAVSWIGPEGSTRGRAIVRIDGKTVARVDLYRSTFAARVVLFTHTFRSTGKHTLTIKVLATPGRPYVAIDELRVKP
jgi:hypothetical protein